MGLDFRLAALRFERLDEGTYQGRAEPEVSYGLPPMTSVEIRAPLTYMA